MATTNAKALLVEMANSLAAEATAAGKTALATALTNFGSEIQSDTATDDSFFQSFDSAGTSTSGKGTTWANILNGAAAVVNSKTQNTIADKASTIATNTTAIAASDAIIATQTTTIASKQTAMETYQKRLKELGEGAGIRTISPTELVGLAKLYQVMIEQGKILDEGDVVSSAQQENAKEKYKQLTKKMETVIRELGPPDLGF